MGSSKKDIKRIELLIVIFLISLLWYYGFDAYKSIIQNTKEAALAQELKIIRQGIYSYVLKYKIYPKDLKEMQDKKIIEFEGKVKNQKYFKNPKIDEKGNLLDPFGNPYIYNNKTGEIKSGTDKYRDM